MSESDEDVFSLAEQQFIESSKNLATLTSSQLIPHTALVFSGGGAKGAIYAGVFAALQDGGVMANVSHNVGTSAGAITTAVLSTGISSANFTKLSQETIFSELLGDGLITKSGIPLANLVKDTIQDNFSSYLNNQQDIPNALQQRLIEVQNQKKLIEDDLAKNVRSLEIFEQDNQQRIAQGLNKEQPNNDQYEDIKNNLKFINNELNNIIGVETKLNNLINNRGDDFVKLKQSCSEKGAKITFADLELMTIYDPKTFKNLTVTAVNKETGELKLFNSKDTPNVEISLAVKASFSIPLFFEPVVIDGVSYVDGGWVNNIPLNALEQNNINQNSNDNQIVNVPNDSREVEKVKNSGRTLAFAFGNDMDSAVNIAIYTSKKVIFDPIRVVKFLIDVVYKNLAGIGGNQKYSENENKTLEGVRKNSIDTLPLNTAKVGTLSFDLAAKKAEYLYIKGYCQTNNFLQNHAVDEKRDLRHDVRSFMLDVYDSSINKQENTWLSMVKSREEGVKSKELLSFCKADKWENEKTTKDDFSEVIKKYVATTCLQSPPKRASENSKTVDTLLEKLNSNNPLIISRDVKKEFCKAIKGNEISNLVNDPKYIDNLKINKDDIKKFLESNKQLLPTLQTSRAR